MKYSICAIVLLYATTSCTTHMSCTSFAHEWVYTYAITSDGNSYLEDNELNLLINFFHVSHQRSCAILNLQEKALNMLQSAWQGWQCVTQLRRDPTHTQTCKLHLDEQVQEFSTQWSETQKLCTNFTTLLEHLIEESTLSDKAHQALQSVQQEEQLLIAHSIAELNQNIQTHTQSPTKGNSILDFVWSCLPPLAIESFIKTDRITMQVSQENWNILQTLQKLTNRNWSELEKTRATLYYSLYKAMYEAVHQHSNAAQFFTSFFKQNQSMPIP